MKKILLLSMPFGALERQALGLSLLKARLLEEGIACDVRYLTFSFAEFIGYDNYQWISSSLPYTAFVGDWTFTHALYGERSSSEASYIQEVLRETWHLDEMAIQRIQHVRSLVLHYLDYCLAIIPWQEYAVVGFTSTFEQNIASLSLAMRIKQAHPEIAIAFGGANWEGEMGVELHRQFSFVNYVCSGEAEHSFPALVKYIIADKTLDDLDRTIPGIVYRSTGGASVYTGPARLLRDMDRLPIPDFSDYFQDLARSTVGALVSPTLLLETSRGCWWGEKSHCTFCGLNGGAMAFRSKSAHRVLDELVYLADHWRIHLVEAVDNILDMRYFNDVLPALASLQSSIRLFYEIKANLSRKQVQILSNAGVYRVQPGIESMSDHILKLMRKGTTALRNIQLLKWCREYNIAVDWNILYGFPGETQEDYTYMLSLLKAIRFLSPPTGYGPIRLDRFSPYFESPAEFGFVNVRPIKPYKYLYPFADESLRRIAYYFDYDYTPTADPGGFAREVIAYVQEWQHNPETGMLSLITRPDGTLRLYDTRSDAVLREVSLVGAEGAAYRYCDSLRTAPAVARYLHETFPDLGITERRVRAFLDSLVANRLMVSNNSYYLSLAVAVPPVKAIFDDTLPTGERAEPAHVKSERSFRKTALYVLPG